MNNASDKELMRYLMFNLFFVLFLCAPIHNTFAVKVEGCDQECLEQLEKLESFNKGNQTLYDSEKVNLYFTKKIYKSYLENASFNEVASLIRVLEKNFPENLETIIYSLVHKDIDLNDFFKIISVDTKNNSLCSLAQKGVTLSMGFMEDSCSSYNECVEHVSSVKPMFSNKFSKHGEISCDGVNIDEYLTKLFDKHVLKFLDIESETQLEKSHLVEVSQDCIDSGSSSSQLDFSVKLSDEMLDILVEARNCSFEEQSKYLPEFFLGAATQGLEQLAKNKMKKDTVYMSMQGFENKCHLLLYTLRLKKEKRDVQTLEESYDLLKLMFQGNTNDN